MNIWLLLIVVFYMILLIIGYIAANYKLGKKVGYIVNILGIVSLIGGIISIVGYFVSGGLTA